MLLSAPGNSRPESRTVHWRVYGVQGAGGEESDSVELVELFGFLPRVGKLLDGTLRPDCASSAGELLCAILD